PDQLDRHALLVLVIVANGEMHGAGLTLAELAEQSIRADAKALAACGRRWLQKPGRLLVGAQQRLDLAPQRGIDAGLIEERGVLGAVERHREIEQTLDLGPPNVAGHVAALWRCRCSHARARRQRRSIVDSDVPR